MNFDFATIVNEHLIHFDFEKALEIAQKELRSLPITDYHDVLDKSMSQQVDDLVQWIDKFYKKAIQKSPVETLYFEMNEFDINTDEWYIVGFGFSTDEGLGPDGEDSDWLCDFDTYSHEEIRSDFTIKGFQTIQKAFEKIEPDTSDLENSRDWCEQIVLIRFMELMTLAHKQAKKLGLGWGEIPIYFTEHEYTFILKHEN